jgi:hypothetical protein
MLKKIPAKISAYIPDAQKSQVKTWWDELSDEDQNALLKSYVLERLHKQSPETVRFYAKFVEGKEKPHQNEFWAIELFEYFINHEIILDDMRRTYHTCYQHIEALTACKQGTIPSDFICPLGKSTCLMTKLTQIGTSKDLRLYIKVDEL